MRKLAIALAATALLASPALHARERVSGEEKLAKVLEGRIAGEPVDCLPYSAQDDVEVIDKTALVYGHGDTIWVNRPSNASNLDDDDIMVRRSHTAQLCKLDTIQMHDSVGYFYSGFVGLEQFVPYRKVAKAN